MLKVTRPRSDGSGETVEEHAGGETIRWDGDGYLTVYGSGEGNFLALYAPKTWISAVFEPAGA